MRVPVFVSASDCCEITTVYFYSFPYRTGRKTDYNHYDQGSEDEVIKMLKVKRVRSEDAHKSMRKMKRMVVECLKSNQVANSTLSREGVTNSSFHTWCIFQAQFRMSHTVRSVGQPRLKPSGVVKGFKLSW